MPDVERPGGVGTYKLDLGPLPCPNLTPTILLPRSKDLGNALLPKTLGKEEVEVTGTAYLDPVNDVRIKFEGAPKEFSNVTRLAAKGAGKGEGDRSCEVSKGRLAGVFPAHLGSLHGEHLACVCCPSERLAQIFSDVCLELRKVRHFRPMQPRRRVPDISHWVNKNSGYFHTIRTEPGISIASSCMATVLPRYSFGGNTQ
jgi:hypothetical protein